MRSLRATFVLPLLLVACTVGPVTGQIVSTDPNGFVFNMSGGSDTPSTQVTALVLKDANLSPTVPANYQSTGTPVLTGTTQYLLGDTKPAYAWFLGTAGMNSTMWPPGGLVRLKARSKYNGSATVADMYTFDSYQTDMTGTSCLSAEINAGTAWRTAGADCASPYELSTIITVVSAFTTPVDANGATLNYLSWRGGLGGDAPEPSDAIPSAGSDATSNYYATIGAPAFLSGSSSFFHKYGFDVIPNDDVHAIYYNAGDLGIGRDMHCKSFQPPAPYPATSPPGKACYVTNYGRQTTFKHLVQFGSLDPQTVIDEAIAGSAIQPPVAGTANTPVATVAMVYDPSFGSNNAVQFIVYDGDGAISNYAALDNGGVVAASSANLSSITNSNINVPNNCLSCHGLSSAYTPRTSGASIITGATFLPFDPDALVFSTNNSTYSKANMLPKIKGLNAHVYDSAPTAAVLTLLKGMYGSANGPKDTGSSFVPTYVPASWTTKDAKQVYNEVVKPYCRTCHVSHNSSGGLDWADWKNSSLTGFNDQSVAIGQTVCLSTGAPGLGTHPMPHAEQTQTRFWKSPARAHLVNALSIGGACAP